MNSGCRHDRLESERAIVEKMTMLEKMRKPDQGNGSSYGEKTDWRATEDVNLPGFDNFLFVENERE